MSKSTVTRLFVGSLIALVAAIVLVMIGVGLAFASGALVTTNPGLTGIDATRFTGAAIVFMTIGALGIVGGAIGQFVAWIGAVVNTARLDDKMWFILLLVLGLLSFGFIATVSARVCLLLLFIAMLFLAGPDGTRPVVDQRAFTSSAA